MYYFKHEQECFMLELSTKKEGCMSYTAPEDPQNVNTVLATGCIVNKYDILGSPQQNRFIIGLSQRLV